MVLAATMGSAEALRRRKLSRPTCTLGSNSGSWGQGLAGAICDQGVLQSTVFCRTGEHVAGNLPDQEAPWGGARADVAGVMRCYV